MMRYAERKIYFPVFADLNRKKSHIVKYYGFASNYFYIHVHQKLSQLQYFLIKVGFCIKYTHARCILFNVLYIRMPIQIFCMQINRRVLEQKKNTMGKPPNKKCYTVIETRKIVIYPVSVLNDSNL